MNSDRRNNFMEEIDARPYNYNTRVPQSNNPSRINPNNRNNNMYPQHKRNIRNGVKANNRRYNRIKTKGALALAALVAAGTITGAVIHNNTNKNIDAVHEAYEYTESVISMDERAISKTGYKDYIETLAAFDKTFEFSDKKEFHDFVRTLNIEDAVLDSEQITNLALEVFKVAFAEKNGVDPMSVTIKHVEPDIVIPQEDFNFNTGKYNYTSISYATSNGEIEEIETDYLSTGYFSYGVFEPSGNAIHYRSDIPEAEYDIINSIVDAQTHEENSRKALKALKLAQEYATKIRDEKTIQQTDGTTAYSKNNFSETERA